ncbi:MAG: PqiC family protein [Deltaproteobacteria bacterium]|jgi:hypothetical protein
MIFRLMVIGLCVFTAMLGGCLGGGTQQRAKFYVLNSLYSSKAGIEAETAKHGLVIGVGPVQLPQYVNRPQIVTRTSRNELNVADFARWGEPLGENFARVLAENISVLFSTDRVIVYPWRRSTQIDYQVLVDVTRFDGAVGGDVSMRARWTLLGDRGEKVFTKRNSRLSARTDARTYEALVAAQSRMLVDLSREIADEIKALSK